MQFGESLCFNTCGEAADHFKIGATKDRLFQALMVSDDTAADAIAQLSQQEFDAALSLWCASSGSPTLAQQGRARLMYKACRSAFNPSLVEALNPSVTSMPMADLPLEIKQVTTDVSIPDFVKLAHAPVQRGSWRRDRSLLKTSPKLFSSSAADLAKLPPVTPRSFDETTSGSGSEGLEPERESVLRWAKAPIEQRPPQSVAIVMNPISGRKDGHMVMQSVAQFFAERNIQVTQLVSNFPGHERQLARETSERTICCLGGRGSLREVLSGILEREDAAEVTLALLPNGTPENVNLNFGIRDALSGAEVVARGNVRRLDLLKVQDLATQRVWYSASNVYYGACAKYAAKAQSMRQNLGRAGLAMVALGSMAAVNRTWRAAVQLPEGEVPDEQRQRFAVDTALTGVLATVGQFWLGDQHFPGSTLDDGLMNIRIRVVGKRIEGIYPIVDNLDTVVAVSECTILPNLSPSPNKFQVGPNTLLVDGDVVCGTPARLTVLKGAIRMFS